MTDKMPMQLLRTYIPFEMLLSIKDWVKKKPFKSESEATRYFMDIGMKIESMKSIMEDPEKSKQFIDEMKKMMKADQIFNWIETLDDTQLLGMSQAVSVEKERRAPKQRQILQ
jgi:hypothetical protein